MEEEVVTLLPKGKEKRERLIHMLKEAEKLEIVKESANISLKDIKQAAKDELEISAKDFNLLLNAWMDDTYAHEEFSKAETLLHTNEILRTIEEG